ncbi:HU family DNA-binding protein [Microcoleus sp. D3_18a_C4]|uniref:HU family DNA-binding protein n=1 Tax=unclassified Microcoleus TaxID=2642155 RepID=UPI002FD37382
MTATLTDHVKASTGFAESTIAAVVNSITTFLSTSLRNGEEVKLEGLGTFKVTDKPERQGRNPRTGEAMTFKASRKPKLTFSKGFLTSIQPDPNALPVASVAHAVAQQEARAIQPPPIPVDLMTQTTASTANEQVWQIKAPDGSFIEAATSELSGWGVTASTPVYSSSTGWKLAGKIPELAGIVK